MGKVVPRGSGNDGNPGLPCWYGHQGVRLGVSSEAGAGVSSCVHLYTCLGACMPAESWGRSRDPVDLRSQGAGPGAEFTKEVPRDLSASHIHVKGVQEVRNSNSYKGFVRRISLGEG